MTMTEWFRGGTHFKKRGQLVRTRAGSSREIELTPAPSRARFYGSLSFLWTWHVVRKKSLRRAPGLKKKQNAAAGL